MEWVALMTFAPEPMFYEEGGVYDHKPDCGRGGEVRPLDPSDRLVACPRCGQRFAGTDECTPEQNRDLHFDGGEDCPSICRDFPARPKGLRQPSEWL
jgi:hypothetical protein